MLLHCHALCYNLDNMTEPAQASSAGARHSLCWRQDSQGTLAWAGVPSACARQLAVSTWVRRRQSRACIRPQGQAQRRRSATWPPCCLLRSPVAPSTAGRLQAGDVDDAVHGNPHDVDEVPARRGKVTHVSTPADTTAHQHFSRAPEQGGRQAAQGGPRHALPETSYAQARQGYPHPLQARTCSPGLALTSRG